MQKAHRRGQSLAFLLILLMLTSLYPIGSCTFWNNNDEGKDLLSPTIDGKGELSDSDSGNIGPLSYSAARSTTTWSGNVWLNSSYSVNVADELVISSCTQVWLNNGVRLYVAGRLKVEGTTACPAIFHSQGGADHEGIQFNSTSNGRGSVINNLTIENSLYGITIYSSNPQINNLTVISPDYLGIDIFNGAAPFLNDITITGAGFDVISPTFWRYGIGISVGNLSTPVVNRVSMDGLITRGINFWGNSGGLFNNVSISNVSGATLAIAAGIWVMDARPLFQDLTIHRSDNGIWVRHYDDSLLTRLVLRRGEITDSMYRGMRVDKYDPVNYTNYQSAVVNNLTIFGTGGSGAKTPGLAEAGLEINASGAWIEDTVIENTSAPGIRLYFTDWNTVGRNVTILNSGEVGGGAHAAGLTVRSTYFAPDFSDLTVKGSPGAGVWAWGGGAIQGDNWHLYENAKQGLYVNSATVWVDGIEAHDNGYSGLKVEDARNVEISNLNSYDNGAQALDPSNGAGLVFIEANDLESQSGDIHCLNCVSTNDAWGGVWAQDSVDLIIENMEVHEPGNNTSSIVIDNGGLTHTQQGGWVDLIGIETWQNTTAPAIDLNQAVAIINGLQMNENHSGIRWNGDHNMVLSSQLINANLSGTTSCLDLVDHSYLRGENITLSSECSGSLTFTNVQANWSTLNDETGSHALTLDQASDIRLHRPINVDLNLATIPSPATVSLAWDFGVWVINLANNGVPSAGVSVDFDQLNQNFSYQSDYGGYDFFGNWVGQIWTSSGGGVFTDINISCAYDNTTNATNLILDQDIILFCNLDLANQPPFIGWTTPQDGEQFSSGGVVIFNATSSWDLDNDTVIATWTSNVDGDLLGNCVGQGQGFPPDPIQMYTYLEMNQETQNWSGNMFCPLSDGFHDITLELCDEGGLCVSETRQIELTNLPPILSVGTVPAVDFDGVLRIPWTIDVLFDAYATHDPEGDTLQTTISASNCFDQSSQGWWNDPSMWNGTELEWNVTFAQAISENCQVTLSFSDGVNPTQYWNADVELDNELPNANFSLLRNGTTSQTEVTLDASNTTDPEGDMVVVQWISSLDGLLSNGTGSEYLIWDGYLSKGVHTITLRVSDDTVGNIGLWSDASILVSVDNSPPVSIISSPQNAMQTDSSELIDFIASGSGDWDSWCDTFPVAAGVEWHCSATDPYSGSDWLQVKWESNISGEIADGWLIWSGRLEAGNHTITLSIDDGLSNPVVSQILIDVTPSAPVLEMVDPQNDDSFTSANIIWWDASNSTDFDNDNFTMTVNSDLLNEAILDNVSAYDLHQFRLPSGTHSLTVTLTDETGMVSEEVVVINVIESGPEVAMTSPENGRYYPPASALLLSANATVDYDGDIVGYQWFEYVNGTEVLLLEEKWGMIYFGPGSHHIALYVEDTRGASEWAHVNITLGDSAPKLNQSSLIVKPMTFTEGELTTIEVTIELTDLDGTTEDVAGQITHGIQIWNFILNDAGEGRDLVAGDGIWTGTVDVEAEGAGKPHLRIVATDMGSGEAKVSIATAELLVKEMETDMPWAAVGGSIGGVILLIFLANMFISFRRRRLASMDVIGSWTSFSDATSSVGIDQASVVDAAEESAVQMENDLQMQEMQHPLDVQTAEGSQIQSGKDLPKI
ncbi:MAG TPA: right-handed parallel beta-helix repeat-containing protein [Candidatus Poseidoniales archaeon]|nr:MAG: hypothetical protein CXT68_02830 [Euryarchaeota archaeon]HIG03303.1 right-handed parallel beta-helix repeat-containing protein [Candidatus Poseidoniales archaeon]HIK78493.1 right-handed parallel beta-helix repeat-containing protein [Candidatus Poseidoniales archaeon]